MTGTPNKIRLSLAACTTGPPKGLPAQASPLAQIWLPTRESCVQLGPELQRPIETPPAMPKQAPERPPKAPPSSGRRRE